MRRIVAIVGVIGGCSPGPGSTTTTTTTTTTIPEPARPVVIDAMAVVRGWEGIDGDNWQERLSRVADDAREEMAKTLLRDGNFACAFRETPIDCDTTAKEFVPVAKTDGIDAPCLRRELAFWALDQLDGETLETELAADLIAIAGLPPPEDELNRAAFSRVEDQTLRLQMLDAAERAGNDTVADESLGGLSGGALAEAALELHVDGALEVMDAADAPELYARAVADRALRRETRIHAVRELAEANLELAAVEAAIKDDDCAVAAAAMTALGRPLLVPRTPDLAAYRRMACVALWTDFDWTSVIGVDGIVVTRHFADPSATPPTWSEVERIPRSPDLPLSDDLKRAACTAAECRLPGQPVWLTLGWKKVGKRLLLTTIDRREHASCP